MRLMQRKVVTTTLFNRSLSVKRGALKRTRGNKKTKNKQMKRNLLILLVMGTVAVGGFAFAQAQGQSQGPGQGQSQGQGQDQSHGQGQGGPGPGGRHGHGGPGGPLENLTETLNLTPDQKAKIQPIVDQAKPQIAAIHQEAMQKTKAVMDNAMAQIRPLLTPDQQKKADDMREAHHGRHKAIKEGPETQD